MSSDKHVDFLRRFFFSRTDYVAISAPWNNLKPCPVPVDSEEHLLALLAAHVLGTKAPHVTVRDKKLGEQTGWFRLGSYTPAPDGTTRWLCLDFDGPPHADALADPLAAAKLASEKAAALGLHSHLEKSGGGKGWHVWLLFEPGVLAADARKLGVALAPVVPLAKEGLLSDAKKGRGIEVFPKQDRISVGGFGNLVWLPWLGCPGGTPCQGEKDAAL